ncbi:hypothetical protein [Microbacterium sp. MPKO10]|uniref:hypothetical protein n=1 Tax=Microbacterium sp. MPKO10 TaxID=2989818 RepID=UPI002235D0F4|nr:hypothetical protein [Microbacterium sp. MPKO10]MCW4459475.1 hypothetical protein [Microbacterium sp. MPKO10]
MIGIGAEPGARECSRAGCRETASWLIGWRNPRIHSADREKIWLACDEHVDYLRDFLEARSFPVAVRAFSEDDEQ